jgi:hypothetical protein
VVARNASEAAPFGVTGGTLTEIQEVGTRRLTLMQVTPNTSSTSLALTSVTAGVWSWSCLNLGAVAPRQVARAVGAAGNSTTSPIELPAVTIPAASGHELAVAIAATNSTATWTAPAGTTTRAALTAAPGLLVCTTAPTAGTTSVTFGNADRANPGTTRYETSMTVVFRP